MNERKKEKIKVFALGGAGEIGKNMYVVEVGHDIFAVDAGLMFPEDEMLGIDMVIPDTSYLAENAGRIKGVFLTHGHEDHIGGLPFILRYLDVPVYGTKLTLGLAEAKIADAGSVRKIKLRTIDSDTVLTFGGTKVSFFKTNHSIPDSVGVCFHTSQGAIVYTGDFKFDQTPVDGELADFHKMAEIGNQGVLCLLSDSTNAERPGFSGSEALVGRELIDTFSTAAGRVIIAAFATNIHRVQQVFDAAYECGRKVALLGRSMNHVTDIAVRLGHLHIPEDLLVPVEDILKLNDSEIVLLTTGSQGEPMAALSLMAKGANKHVSIKKGDTVIVSATPIPGNELSVTKTVDLLFRAGADVIYGRRKVHVSGHGNQEELKLMLNIMKPKYFIPVHGEYKMQIAHARLAEGAGIAHHDVFLLENGDVVEFADGEASAGGKVPSGNILVDGLGVGDVGNIVLRDRRLLSQDGILLVVVTLSKDKKKVVAGPEILSRGFVYVRESEQLFLKSNEIVLQILNEAAEAKAMDWSTLKSEIRDSLSQYLYEKTKRRPMILPIIMEI
ncbi:ribonuclease J [Bacillus marinisedimentorum]|uniref:ribonuclease J n=1 Tax=Bacillus marinisedimentorum TaxID=1821260 RepID=UPI0007E23097|nr:ribonuclease J [Bacillus marinisedimentorum]